VAAGTLCYGARVDLQGAMDSARNAVLTIHLKHDGTPVICARGSGAARRDCTEMAAPHWGSSARMGPRFPS
jgi:hypothetical protein